MSAAPHTLDPRGGPTSSYRPLVDTKPVLHRDEHRERDQRRAANDTTDCQLHVSANCGPSPNPEIAPFQVWGLGPEVFPWV